MVLQRVTQNLATKQQQESTRPGALAAEEQERLLLTEQS